MYESYFGFREKPFTLHPDPDYLYLSEIHSEVLSHLEYALQEKQGFVVVTGEVGSGKTTLVRSFLRQSGSETQVALLTNTALAPSRFLRAVCAEFKLRSAGLDPVELLDALEVFLRKQHAAGRPVVLVADEAQNIPRETLEELRMLSNLETEKDHLIQIILVGQPQLRDRLRQKGMEQLAQRVTAHCHLTELPAQEVRAYIHHRLQVAGARDLNVFDEGALEAIQGQSRGIPRLINLLCDHGLVYAFAEERKTVTREFIESIVEGRRAAGLWESAEAAPGETYASQEILGRLADLEHRVEFAEERVLKAEERLKADLNLVRVLIAQLKTAQSQIELGLPGVTSPVRKGANGARTDSLLSRLLRRPRRDP